ncbi:hypothetical protein [Streptomyces melanogenes]|uniref:hypothetical protein n=1 Tax=Streptomyces melanogenes TaxID=67326 RepID=UPI0037ABE285
MEQDHGVEDTAMAEAVLLLGACLLGDRAPGGSGVGVAAQAVDHRHRGGGRAE